MNARDLGAVKLDRYAALARQALGPDSALAVCDERAVLLWTSDAGGRSELERSVGELNERGFERLLEDGVGLARLPDGRLLLRAPIAAGARKQVGSLLLVKQQAGDLDAQRSTLTTLASCIGNEMRLQGEVDDLAEELSGRYEELNVVYSLDDHVRSVQQGPGGFKPLLKSFAQNLGVELVALFCSSPPQTMYARGAGGPIPDLDLILTQLRGDLFRFVCSSRRTLILNEGADPRRKYLLPHLPFSVLACPVELGGPARAMLVLLRHADRPGFTNGDRSLGQVIATQTAILMRNQTMLQQMETFSHQLASALIATVEAKDPYTRGHSERVQQVSVRLGRTLGVLEPRVDGIFWGALLHDIGKIGVPDVILAKPCRLTEDEYEFIKMHPERSYEIMRHIEYLGQDALDGARYHQEKFDGTGYPSGLKGKEIPFPARVIAVADTYDAITSSRSYRPARSHDDALDVIRRVSGTQLDPEIVVAFERMCRQDPGWVLETNIRHEDGDD